MRKSVIIGSLVAGAFLLPAIASAGVVTGRCDTCHTMHASQDNVTTTRNPTLLKGSGCAGCHAISFTNSAAGVGGAFNAPQVIATTNTLSGGRFVAASDNQHNVADYGAVDSVLGNNAPGGGNTGIQLTCVNCHDGSGTHHGTSGPYRMLAGVSGSGAADYGVAGRSGNAYDAASLNTFCEGCHTLFHGTGNTDANLGSYGGWLRHPVNIRLADADAAVTRGYVADYAAAANELNETPLGDDGLGNVDVLMCLTCHVAHGSANSDMLAWSYANMNAGSGARDGGCENCHTYGATGY